MIDLSRKRPRHSWAQNATWVASLGPGFTVSLNHMARGEV